MTKIMTKTKDTYKDKRHIQRQKTHTKTKGTYKDKRHIQRQKTHTKTETKTPTQRLDVMLVAGDGGE